MNTGQTLREYLTERADEYFLVRPLMEKARTLAEKWSDRVPRDATTLDLWLGKDLLIDLSAMSPYHGSWRDLDGVVDFLDGEVFLRCGEGRKLVRAYIEPYEPEHGDGDGDDGDGDDGDEPVWTWPYRVIVVEMERRMEEV